MAGVVYAALFMTFILSQPHPFKFHFGLPILLCIWAIYEALVEKVSSYVVVKLL